MAFGTESLITFAFIAGAMTFLAPCAYPLLPGYVSFYLGHGSVMTDVKRGPQNHEETRVEGRLSFFQELLTAVLIGGVVSFGFMVVYGILASIVVKWGSQVFGRISVLELLIGAILIATGAAIVRGWHPSFQLVSLPKRHRSFTGFFAFGVAYGIAAAGCSAPIFIGIVITALSLPPNDSVSVLAAYGVGMSTLMITVTMLTAMGEQRLLTVLTVSQSRLHRVTGWLVIIAGVVQIYLFLFRYQGLELLRTVI